MKKYDVVIIGAGPAGLATAFELTSLTSKSSILVIDAGKSMRERQCNSLDSLCLDHSPCDITHGFGGAGVFSDGKFCLDPEVGVVEDISRFYPKSESLNLMKRVVDMFSVKKQRLKPQMPTKKDLSSCKQAFDEAGLTFEYYNVVRIGLKERLKRMRLLEEHLQSKGVEFSFMNEVLQISPDENYALKTSKGKEIHCNQLVVAPGKVGARWFEAQTQRLEIQSKNNPLYLGFRLELPRQVTSALTKLTDNPKISMVFSNGDRIKTHCFSDKGKVIIATYDDLKLIEGAYYENRETNNASFNVILQIHLPEFVNPYEFSRSFIEPVNSFGQGRPVVQTLGDLFSFSKTDLAKLKDLSIVPSLNDCKSGDLSHIFSMRLADRAKAFLQRIDRVIPGVADPYNLIYGPFAEWWMKKIQTNRFFETSQENLYAIGDGAGMSQGIIAAGMQGIACARGIYEKLKH